ncbi:MAG: glycoside hydrolase family 127 protein [Clostridia bacterium]|nr:glycoside hydrolase family 127 protein [Clostridia bacterium]
MIGRAIFNKLPFQPNRLSQLPFGAIKPKGWIAESLSKQAACVKSREYGDDVEVISVLTPIAFITGDESLIKTVTDAARGIIQSQRPDGDIPVSGEYDWWKRSVALGVLRQYFMATGDRDALKCMDKFLKYQLSVLEAHPLCDEACARSSENMLSAIFIYNLTGQKHLLKLLEIIRNQSLDWTNEWYIFPHIRPLSKYTTYSKIRSGLERDAGLNGIYQKVNSREYYLTEARSVAFGLKAPSAVNLFKSGFKEATAFKHGWKRLMKTHGVALDMYTADDHLAGGNPSQGVNLDSVSDMVYTLCDIMTLSEEVPDEIPAILEKLAFNALSAAWSADMRRRQSVLQVNQLSIGKDSHTWFSADSEASVYMERDLSAADAGLARFIAGTWYATGDEGLACVSYAPCEVNYIASGTRVRISVETEYPFEGDITINVEAKAPIDFPIYLRVPGWAEQAVIRLPDGEMIETCGGEMACVRQVWGSFSSIAVKLEMKPRMRFWHHQSASIEAGPILMCLGDGASSYWNWAIRSEQEMELVKTPETAPGFKNGESGLRVVVKAALCDQWKSDGVDFDQVPVKPEVNAAEERELVLIPFGDTFARVAQFPTYT